MTQAQQINENTIDRITSTKTGAALFILIVMAVQGVALYGGLTFAEAFITDMQETVKETLNSFLAL